MSNRDKVSRVSIVKSFSSHFLAVGLLTFDASENMRTFALQSLFCLCVRPFFFFLFAGGEHLVLEKSF